MNTKIDSTFHFLGKQFVKCAKKQDVEDKLSYHCHNLYKKDLNSHFGCINTLGFSQDGELLVSGGDDKRVLLWNCNQITHQNNVKPSCMKTMHLSNIFATIIDADKQHILSSGNDQKVFRHNINSGTRENLYNFDEPVYSVDMPANNSCIFVTGGEDGSIELYDVRAPDSQVRIAFSAGSYHGVTFHPIEQRIIASANSVDGTALWDTRFPEKVLFSYNKRRAGGPSVSSMSVAFDYTGRHLLVLRRKNGPIVYKVDDASTYTEFEHVHYSNMCTMKSACFAGEKDQFIVSGSDDFNIYIWKVPEDNTTEPLQDPHLVLKGHRSIVNQVRYNRHQFLLASSGVEKLVKIWSPLAMANCSGDTTGDEHFVERRRYSHEDYTRLLYQSGQMTHDYENESIEEDPRMLAFFDSLIERTKTNFYEESSDSSDEDDDNTSVARFLRLLLNRDTQDSHEHSTSSPDIDEENTHSENEDASENVLGASILERYRIYRRNNTRNASNNTRLAATENDINSMSTRRSQSNNETLAEDVFNNINSFPASTTQGHNSEGQIAGDENDEERSESPTRLRRLGVTFKTRNYRKQHR